MSKFTWILCIASVCVLALSIRGVAYDAASGMNEFSPVSLYYGNMIRNPAARLEGWNSPSASPSPDPREVSAGPARLAGWSLPSRNSKKSFQHSARLRMSLLRGQDVESTLPDRSLTRFSDYKLISALKRLDFSEHIAEQKLHSFKSDKDTKALGINEFYRNNFED